MARLEGNPEKESSTIMKRTLAVVAALMLAACLIPAGHLQAATPQEAQPQAQPQPQPEAQAGPQPKSQEEFDALQKLSDPDLPPDERIALAEEFLIKFPDTDFKTFIYRQEMAAYQQKNDFTNMLEFGEKVLAAEPDDAITLIMLASAIPERTRENDLDRDEKLRKAEEYSRRALAAIDNLAKPNPAMPDADWDRARDDARGQVHASLGLVFMHRKNFDEAEQQFKKATELQQQKDPIVFWRLGLAYRSNKKYEQARDAYQQSVALGGVRVGDRDLAAEELKVIDEFLKKRQQEGQGAATTPAP
jgi:tetratricopeptide (TPR) repeat protein